MIRLLKRTLFDALAQMKFGTSRPESITPPLGTSPIFFNPVDRRAIRNLVHGTVRGRISVPVRFWRQAVKTLQPDLAIDAGANYGECFASASYPPHTRVIAVEANPDLIPYLEKTRAAHPAGDAFRIVNCIVDQKMSHKQTFYFSSNSTGGGNAVKPENASACERVEVDCRTLDHIVQEHAGSGLKSLLIKVDTEGHEGRVFAGFQRLQTFDRVVGILEFDPRLLSRAGTDPREFFESLLARFCVFDTRRRQCALHRIHNWEQLVRRHSSKRIHTDLVFLSSEAEIPAGWNVSG